MTSVDLWKLFVKVDRKASKFDKLPIKDKAWAQELLKLHNPDSHTIDQSSLTQHKKLTCKREARRVAANIRSKLNKIGTTNSVVHDLSPSSHGKLDLSQYFLGPFEHERCQEKLRQVIKHSTEPKGGFQSSSMQSRFPTDVSDISVYNLDAQSMQPLDDGSSISQWPGVTKLKKALHPLAFSVLHSRDVKKGLMKVTSSQVTVGPHPFLTAWHVEELGMRQEACTLSGPAVKIWFLLPQGIQNLREAVKKCDVALGLDKFLESCLRLVQDRNGLIFIQRNGDSHNVPALTPHAVLTLFPKKLPPQNRPKGRCWLYGKTIFEPMEDLRHAVQWVNNGAKSSVYGNSSPAAWVKLLTNVAEQYPDSFTWTQKRVQIPLTMQGIMVLLQKWATEYGVSHMLHFRTTTKRRLVGSGVQNARMNRQRARR